jgi:hypothetical protein
MCDTINLRLYSIEAEQREIERRRKMTDQEIMREDAEKLEADRNKRKNSKFRFMQKYYHKGAFFTVSDAWLVLWTRSSLTVNICARIKKFLNEIILNPHRICHALNYCPKLCKYAILVNGVERNGHTWLLKIQLK